MKAKIVILTDDGAAIEFRADVEFTALDPASKCAEFSGRTIGDVKWEGPRTEWVHDGNGMLAPKP